MMKPRARKYRLARFGRSTCCVPRRAVPSEIRGGARMRVAFRLPVGLLGCLCLAAIVAGAGDAAAAPPHHVRSAKMQTAPPIVPLSQIRAFDSLPAPFAL